MPRPLLPLARHRTVDQIRAKYRACRHPVEKARWHALWLLARTDEPRTPAQVAGLVGLSAVTARDVLRRWRIRKTPNVTRTRLQHEGTFAQQAGCSMGPGSRARS